MLPTSQHRVMQRTVCGLHVRAKDGNSTLNRGNATVDAFETGARQKWDNQDCMSVHFSADYQQTDEGSLLQRNSTVLRGAWGKHNIFTLAATLTLDLCLWYLRCGAKRVCSFIKKNILQKLKQRGITWSWDSFILTCRTATLGHVNQ